VARLFTAASSEIAANTTAAPATAAPLTIAGWINLSAYPSVAARVFSLKAKSAADARHCFQLTLNTAGPVVAQSASGAGISGSSGTANLALNTWQHIGGVFASATSRVAYLDGTADTPETTSRIPSGIDAVTMGGGIFSTSSYSRFITGSMAEWAVWNVALNATELAMLAAGVHPRRIRPANLVWRQASDDQRHIVLDDVSGLHLTLSGTQYVPDIPPLVAARNPKRAARVYAFPSGSTDIALTQGAVETLTLTEYAGQTGVSIDIAGALETLALTEYQGTVSADVSITGALETLALTEYAGTVSVDIAITGALETLTLTEYAGTVSLGQDINLSGTLETLTLTEYAGVVGVTIDLTGTLETLVLTEYQGTVDVGSDISLSGNLETLALTEYQGTTGVSIDLVGALETLALTEYSGTVSITNDIVLSGNLETLTLTEYAGVTSVSIDITGALETLTLTEYQGLPGVSMDLVGALETLTLTEYTGTLTYSEAIQLVGNLETLVLTEFAGTITLDVSLTGALETLLLTEYTGTLLLYDPLARVWRQYTFANDERRLETTVTQAVENSFISNDEADTFVTGT